MKLSYPIIGFTGKASAGKDTVSNMVIAQLSKKEKHGVRIACADPLKEVCYSIFGTAFNIPKASFYGSQAEKEKPIENIPDWSGRRILQYIGTEGFRHVHDEVWPRLMLGRARQLIDSKQAHLVCVSDVRFLSEASAIQNAGGLIVRVKRPEADRVVSNHASETQLADIKEDFIIDNQGRELYLLEKLVEEFLCQLNF